MRRKKQTDRELTDLEAVVLAFVHRHHPCTAYRIRLSFEKSTTTQFSTSAGSIYPLVKRLTDRGYLIPHKARKDSRGSVSYRVSTDGVRKVKSWLASLSDPNQIGIYDPIRSRLANLSLLTPPQRRRWIDSMRTLLERQQELIKDYETQTFVGDQRLYEVIRRSLWNENEMRIQWLADAGAALEGDTGAD